MNIQDERFECLRLASADTSKSVRQVLIAAESYYNFVQTGAPIKPKPKPKPKSVPKKTVAVKKKKSRTLMSAARRLR